MPKVSVYLPDDLYRAARERELPISALAQRAVAEALRASATQRWIDRVRAREPRVTRPLDTAAAIATAREEFGA